MDKTPYGDVSYADPGYQADGKKRYPIDTAEHVHSALSYIGKASNAAKYSADQLAKIKARITAAAKKFGIEVSDEPDADDKSESKSSESAGAAHEGTPAEARTNDDAGPEATSSTRESSTTPTSRKAIPMAMSIDEMRARLDEISERMTELGGDETRSLDDAEQTEFDALDAEYTQVEKRIEAVQRRMERIKSLASRGAVEETTAPKAPAFIKKQDDIFDVAELRSMSYSGDDFLRRVGDNAMRAVESAKFAVPKGSGQNVEDAQEVAAGYLENIDTEDRLLAKRYLLTGSGAYESAFGKVVRYGNDAFCTNEERQALARAAQALSTDSAGGYAVPFQLDPTVILTNAGTTNPIRQLARQEQIVGKQWQGVTSNGATVSRGAEASTAVDGSLTLAQPTVSTNRVTGFVPFSIEIELSWNALRTEITKALVDAKAREEDSFITGDGTGTNPGGVVGSLSGNTVTAGGVASFAAADVYALQAALDPRWEAGSSFLAHKAIYHKVRQFDTAGGSQLWARIGDGRPNELMAYPAMAASAMDNVLTTGKKILLYGDFSQFLIVDRIGMSVETVPHLFDPANSNRPTGQRGVFAIWMNNSKILVNSAFKLLVTG